MHTCVMPSPTLLLPAQQFAERFNHDSFGFGHNLHELGLFSFDRLLQVAARYAAHPADYFVAAAAPSAGTGFNSVRHSHCSVEQALQCLDREPTRVLLKRPENHDPEFRSLLDALFAQVTRARGGLHGERLVRLESAVFITSAASITPFHFDPEIAFFMQVEGRKIYHVYAPSSVSESELEQFYRHGEVSIAEVDLKSRDAGLEHVYNLNPGDGHHQPHDSPHWVETGAGRSVSYSFVFETSATRARGRTHACNYYLRRAGMTPSRPGVSPLRDAAKAAAIRVAFPVRRRLLRLLSRAGRRA
jgi:Cupin superfamily protein